MVRFPTKTINADNENNNYKWIAKLNKHTVIKEERLNRHILIFTFITKAIINLPKCTWEFSSLSFSIITISLDTTQE